MSTDPVAEAEKPSTEGGASAEVVHVNAEVAGTPEVNTVPELAVTPTPPLVQHNTPAAAEDPVTESKPSTDKHAPVDPASTEAPPASVDAPPIQHQIPPEANPSPTPEAPTVTNPVSDAPPIQHQIPHEATSPTPEAPTVTNPVSDAPPIQHQIPHEAIPPSTLEAPTVTNPISDAPPSHQIPHEATPSATPEAPTVTNPVSDTPPIQHPIPPESTTHHTPTDAPEEPPTLTPNLSPIITESSPLVTESAPPSETTPVQTTLKPLEQYPPPASSTPSTTTTTTTTTDKTTTASSDPKAAAKPPRKPKENPEEVSFWITASLLTLGLLGTILLFVADGLSHPATKFLPLYIIGYRVFYHFFPHDWVKEKYFMSHLHLGLVLLVGITFQPVFSLDIDTMCQDSVAARHINMNSIAYFFVDTLVLIDTLWITHHFFSIGCALFGIAGVNQVLGGSVYVWYAEIGGLLYHISRMWPDSKLVRQIFLVCYFVSRVCMLWIASISWRCTLTLNDFFSVSFFIDLVLSCFTTGVALVNMKFLYVNYRNYVKRFASAPSSSSSRSKDTKTE